jgi:uncharacterized membrane protein
MIAWRILAETHSLTTTVTMMISRMSDTWVQASVVIAALSGRPGKDDRGELDIETRN